MADLRSEEEQLEAFKHWWQSNGKSLIAGITIAVAGIGGWKAWETYNTQRAEAASALYQQLTTVIQQPASDQRNKEANALVEKLTGEYDGSIYADYADLFAARIAVEQKDYAAATGYLRHALKHSQVDTIQLVARLRLARVLKAQAKPDEALALLNGVETGSFEAEYDALKGDLLVATGKEEEARAAYNKALTASREQGQSDPTLQMKIDNLGSQGDA
ncbi:hypothetical protein BFW38_00955 [Terasakiispira papahanaumokuakeensis]|uniref:Ancillary SecYEG translocon subunit n=1 Tax=Terasakiispira papahanaumokuakeensis TaxID=197479 RepID=A0A1E2V5Y4_9GAMM|nr:tetratricopeptide repeat protein [Terasakiispira papahanaumokuakeensis]ODC02323.1 hypothetical protein BFW38_00955 [Terasakiispira papahanaumokuakeensis]